MINHQSRTLIICFGAPRSGLGLLSRVLGFTGSVPLSYHGYSAADINSLLFQELGHSPLMFGSLPDGWQNSSAAIRTKQRIANLLAPYEEKCSMGHVHDSLFSRVFPLWLEVLRAKKIETFCAHMIRHPWQTAVSMNTDQGINLPKGMLIWFSHVRDAIRQIPVQHLITFEQLISDPISTLKIFTQKLDFPDETLFGNYGEILSYVTPVMKDNQAGKSTDQIKVSFKFFEDYYHTVLLGQRKQAFFLTENNDSFLADRTKFAPGGESLPLLPDCRTSPIENGLVDIMLDTIADYQKNQQQYSLNNEKIKYSSKDKNALYAILYFNDSHCGPEKLTEYNRHSEIILPDNEWHEIRKTLMDSSLLRSRRIILQPIACNGMVTISTIKIKNPDTNKTLWEMTKAEDFADCKIEGDAFRINSEENFLIVVTGKMPRVSIPIYTELKDGPMELIIWLRASTDQSVIKHYIDDSKKIVPRKISADKDSAIYNKDFYESQKNGSEMSAKAVLSCLFSIYKPNSIIDIGCGVGTWIKAAMELGVKDALGVDGKYVENELIIPFENFAPIDLDFSLPKLGYFDLAISLEVAEHLSPNRAESFIKNICNLSDVIMFSAAIPYQGGTNHRNERWPEFWANQFRLNGFIAVDCLREKLWRNYDVEWWYRQNIVLFMTHTKAKSIFYKQAKINPNNLSQVHPELFLKVVHNKKEANRKRYLKDIQLYRKEFK